MTDFFNDRTLMNGFGHTVGRMTPSGKVLNNMGNATGEFIKTASLISVGDTTWLTKVGTLTADGRVIDDCGNLAPVQLAPLAPRLNPWSGK